MNIKLPYQLFIFSILMLLVTSVSAASQLVLRTAETHPESYPTAQALLFMNEKLKELSNNNIKLKLYAGGQLGEEKDALELTIFGGIDLSRINMAPLSSVIPETSVLGLPFLFSSTEHMRKVIDSDIGDHILSSFEPYGLIGLAFYDSGARSLYNNKHAIRTPSDVVGLKIRVQNSEIDVAMIHALGGNPTPMGFGQVYESLLLGTIDGSENNWPSYESTGHYEAAPYYTLTRHTMTPEVLVMSKHRWDTLNTIQQKIIRKAAKVSVSYMRTLWDKRVNDSSDKVISSGAKVIANPNMAPFIEAMKPVYKKFIISAEMQVLVDRIRGMDTKNRGGSE